MRWLTVGILFLAAFFATAARGDIYQWEYIDPLHTELGRQQFSTLAPDGAGLVQLADGRDLTQAYLGGFNLTGAEFWYATLTGADFTTRTRKPPRMRKKIPKKTLGSSDDFFAHSRREYRAYLLRGH